MIGKLALRTPERSKGTGIIVSFLIASCIFLICHPALAQLRCLDKRNCAISSDSQLKACTSNLDCYCAKGDTERICTGTACSLSLTCSAGQVIKDYSCDGFTWKVGSSASKQECGPELKTPLTPLSQLIWCCGAPPPSNPATGGGVISGSGGSTNGSNPPTGSGAGSSTGVSPLASFLAKNKKLQDFFKADAAAAAALFATFSPIIPAKQTGPFLVYAKDRDVVNNSGVEIDLGATSYKQSSPMVTVTLKNNSAAVLSLIELRQIGGYGVLQQGFSKVSMAPASTTNFQLQLENTSSGVKSAAYILSYRRGAATAPIESFRFSAGGIVWSSLEESKDFGKKRVVCPDALSPVVATVPTPQPFPSGPPDLCSRPPRSINPAFPKMGSEELALLKATTDQQFDALIPRLTLSRAEQALKSQLPRTDLGTRLFKLVVITNRLLVSRGAVASLPRWSADLLAARTTSLKATNPRISTSGIQESISQEILAEILPIIQNVRDDTYGQARSQLVLALSNIRELKILNRLTSSVLLSRGVEDIANLNGMGRYSMRAALTRTYLSTNPPLDEANVVLSGVLQGISDAASKAPLTQMIYSQYPELWVAQYGGVKP